MEERVEPNTERGSGIVLFAGTMAAIVGVFNILSGIAAISKDDVVKQAGQALFDVDINAWGWFWLIIGVLQLVTSYLIFRRSLAGLVVGVIWAGISASLAVFVIFTYPIWALVVIGIDVLIIFGLLDNIDEFS
jgi:hypothetical protein